MGGTIVRGRHRPPRSALINSEGAVCTRYPKHPYSVRPSWWFCRRTTDISTRGAYGLRLVYRSCVFFFSFRYSYFVHFSYSACSARMSLFATDCCMNSCRHFQPFRLRSSSTCFVSFGDRSRFFRLVQQFQQTIRQIFQIFRLF